MLLPRTKLVYLACVSHDKGRAAKDVCRVGCTACGLCVKNCPTGALALVNNLPVMDFEKCIDCGICVHKCPTKSYVDRAPGRPKATINPNCNGCGDCVKVCKFKAIEGETDAQHRVLADKCIGCGECRKVCKADAIQMVGALGHAARVV
jgi:ferredoxin